MRTHKWKLKLTVPLVWSLVAAVLVIWLVLSAVVNFYRTHFLPQTVIAGQDITGLSFVEAAYLVEEREISSGTEVTIYADNVSAASSSGELGLRFDVGQTLAQVQEQQQKMSAREILRALVKKEKRACNLSLKYDLSAVEELLTALASAVDQPGLRPTVSLVGKQVVVDPGKDTLTLDQAATLSRLLERFPEEASIEAVVVRHQHQLDESAVSALQAKGESLLGKSLVFKTEALPAYAYTLDADRLVSLLVPGSDELLEEVYDEVNAQVGRPTQEPELVLGDGQKVEKFLPPLDGLVLDQNDFSTSLTQGLRQLIDEPETRRLEVELTLGSVPPQKQLSETNNLGINELIGFGESYYAHSIAGRIHNVALAAANIDGTLVAPGEEFRFNDAVGEVSSKTGYQGGYIIKNGRSELSAGGGVCQVSTTVFRALLDAGVQITLRKPHSYRVTYYELNNDPGFDATVYTGETDLRFINDTDHYILIDTETDSEHTYMTVKLWGTSDGRYTEVSNYTKTNPVSPPATQYIPDPSLPPGTRQQIDWAVAGLTTNFTHTIYNADGSVRSQKDYPSKYQAWSAKFLVGPEQ